MPIEQKELGFTTSDDWSVHEFHAFFHQINILYNRIYVLDEQLKTGKIRKLSPLLYGSLSRVDDVGRLYLDSIEIRSPGEFNLKGAGGILKEFREFWKDIRYRNEIEKTRLEEEFRHAQEMNVYKENKAGLKILGKRIRMMKELGYDLDQIQVVEKALGDPMNQLIVLSQRKGIQSKSPNNQKQADA